MKRLALAIAGLLIAGTAALANGDGGRPSLPPPFEIDHNGSLMIVEYLSPSHFQIRYEAPRPAMAGLVRPGTVLFDGVFVGEGGVEGTAHVFYAACPPAPYHVSGGIAEGDAFELVLHGVPPVVNEWDCSLLGFNPHSVNATLAFHSLRR